MMGYRVIVSPVGALHTTSNSRPEECTPPVADGALAPCDAGRLRQPDDALTSVETPVPPAG